MKSKPPVIAHYHSEWLPSTMTWLHEQIVQLQSLSENHVLCERQIDGTPFKTENLHSFDQIPVFRQYLHRIAKKTDLATHLPFYKTTAEAIGADIIHAHFGHMGMAMLPVARALDIPLVVTFYGMDVHQLPRLFPDIKRGYDFLFKDVSGVLCEGEYMANDIIKLGCPAEKVHVHRLGIDVNGIPFRYPSTENADNVRILIAASFREKKGIPLALEAIAALRTEFPLTVTIIGDAGVDEASKLEKKRIQDVIAANKMQNIVHMAGYTSHADLKNAAREHDIFLSPSIHASDGDCEGGAPVTIIEMAAAGLIVVSSTHCDIPGVIRNHETGFLAQEGSLQDLIHILRKAIENKAVWRDMAIASRNHIESQFNAGTQAKLLLNHYKEAIYAFR